MHTRVYVCVYSSLLEQRYYANYWQQVGWGRGLKGLLKEPANTNNASRVTVLELHRCAKLCKTYIIPLLHNDTQSNTHTYA